jgi:membrane protein implicated in regulation of membrane protease activity
VDPLPRLIAHHTSASGIAVELGVIAVVGILLALVWWRGQRRRRGPEAKMRDS